MDDLFSHTASGRMKQVIKLPQGMREHPAGISLVFSYFHTLHAISSAGHVIDMLHNTQITAFLRADPGHSFAPCRTVLNATPLTLWQAPLLLLIFLYLKRQKEMEWKRKWVGEEIGQSENQINIFFGSCSFPFFLFKSRQ